MKQSKTRPLRPLSSLTLAAGTALLLQMAGCSTVAGSTNMLSDERVIAESAGTLGLVPADLKLQSRTTSGTNTYAILRGRDGKEYSCTINGGNLLSFGMTNPPACQRK